GTWSGSRRGAPRHVCFCPLGYPREAAGARPRPGGEEATLLLAGRRHPGVRLGVGSPDDGARRCTGHGTDLRGHLPCLWTRPRALLELEGRAEAAAGPHAGLAGGAADNAPILAA